MNLVALCFLAVIALAASEPTTLKSKRAPLLNLLGGGSAGGLLDLGSVTSGVTGLLNLGGSTQASGSVTVQGQIDPRILLAKGQEWVQAMSGGYGIATNLGCLAAGLMGRDMGLLDAAKLAQIGQVFITKFSAAPGGLPNSIGIIIAAMTRGNLNLYDTRKLVVMSQLLQQQLSSTGAIDVSGCTAILGQTGIIGMFSQMDMTAFEKTLGNYGVGDLGGLIRTGVAAMVQALQKAGVTVMQLENMKMDMIGRILGTVNLSSILQNIVGAVQGLIGSLIGGGTNKLPIISNLPIGNGGSITSIINGLPVNTGTVTTITNGLPINSLPINSLPINSLPIINGGTTTTGGSTTSIINGLPVNTGTVTTITNGLPVNTGTITTITNGGTTTTTTTAVNNVVGQLDTNVLVANGQKFIDALSGGLGLPTNIGALAAGLMGRDLGPLDATKLAKIGQAFLTKFSAVPGGLAQAIGTINAAMTHNNFDLYDYSKIVAMTQLLQQTLAQTGTINISQITGIIAQTGHLENFLKMDFVTFEKIFSSYGVGDIGSLIKTGVNAIGQALQNAGILVSKLAGMGVDAISGILGTDKLGKLLSPSSSATKILGSIIGSNLDFQNVIGQLDIATITAKGQEWIKALSGGLGLATNIGALASGLTGRDLGKLDAATLTKIGNDVLSKLQTGQGGLPQTIGSIVAGLTHNDLDLYDTNKLAQFTQLFQQTFSQLGSIDTSTILGLIGQTGFLENVFQMDLETFESMMGSYGLGTLAGAIRTGLIAIRQVLQAAGIFVKDLSSLGATSISNILGVGNLKNLLNFGTSGDIIGSLTGGTTTTTTTTQNVIGQIAPDVLFAKGQEWVQSLSGGLGLPTNLGCLAAGLMGRDLGPLDATKLAALGQSFIDKYSAAQGGLPQAIGNIIAAMTHNNLALYDNSKLVTMSRLLQQQLSASGTINVSICTAILGQSGVLTMFSKMDMTAFEQALGNYGVGELGGLMKSGVGAILQALKAAGLGVLNLEQMKLDMITNIIGTAGLGKILNLNGIGGLGILQTILGSVGGLVNNVLGILNG